MDSSLEPKKPLILSQKKKQLFQNSQEVKVKSQIDNFNENSSYLGPCNLELSQVINGSQSSRILNKINSQANLCEQLEDVKGQKMVQSYQYQKVVIDSHRYDQLSFQEGASVNNPEQRSIFNNNEISQIIPRNSNKSGCSSIFNLTQETLGEDKILLKQQQNQDFVKINSMEDRLNIAVKQLDNLSQKVKILTDSNLKLQESLLQQEQKIQDLEKIKSVLEQSVSVLESDNVKLVEEIKVKATALERSEQIFKEENERHYRDKYLQLEETQSLINEKDKAIDNLNNQIDQLQRELQMVNSKSICAYDSSSKIISSGNFQSVDFLKLQIAAEKKLLENDKLLLENEKTEIKNEKDKIQQDKEHIEQMIESLQADRQQFEQQKKQFYQEQNKIEKELIEQSQNQFDEILLKQQIEKLNEIILNQQQNIQDLNQKVQKSQDENQIDQNKLEEQSKQNNQANQRIQILEQKLQQFQLKAQTKEEEINQTFLQNKENEIKLIQYEDLRQEQQKQINELKQQIELLSKANSQMKIEHELSQKDHKLNSFLQEEIIELKKQKQQLELSQYENLQKEIQKNEKIQEEINTLKQNLSQQTNKVQQITKNNFEYQLKIEQLQIQLSEITHLKNNQNEVSDLCDNSILQSKKANHFQLQESLSLFDNSTQNLVNQQNQSIYQAKQECKCSQLTKQSSEKMELKLIQIQNDYKSLLSENENLISKQQDLLDTIQNLKNQIRLLNISKEDLQKYCDSLESHLSQSQQEYEISLKQLEEQKAVQINALQQELEVYHKNSSSNNVSSSLKSACNIFKHYASQKENISYQSISKKVKQVQREPYSPHQRQNERNEQNINQSNNQMSKRKNCQQSASPISKIQIQSDMKDRESLANKQRISFQNQKVESCTNKNEKDSFDSKRLQVICAKTNVSPLRTSLNITNIRDTSVNKKYY
ncbi:hypothetical protein TTHERM_00127120 (macronuclear) [Tetrahymena thermophila SB210]|uniref:Uncharacterized protein n=1 Tax=Tetrahymena thermophila (strain SB210) TaxID=312017 RepID=I7M1C2_TETTS|nr:hypothetical protein TTHERM_00127120 [Tetrahymena thermophila SB210]EAR96047.2 hypothetical protein TTHERM_00127120 [Tetrahymena thermophila SB210]|eukprot:XP_001016292.2 hypothetical protein TTHERM_00127120 [Tetrahymena thermophila SB210]